MSTQALTELKAIKSKKAFTLVELLIVVIIIAILAAIAIPKFINSSLRSKEASAKAELKLVRDGVELFKNDTGLYPSVLGDLAVTTAPANGLTNLNAAASLTASTWRGPYITSVDNNPVDGTALTYSVNSGTGLAKVGISTSGNDSSGTAYSSY